MLICPLCGLVSLSSAHLLFVKGYLGLMIPGTTSAHYQNASALHANLSQFHKPSPPVVDVADVLARLLGLGALHPQQVQDLS